MPKINVLDRQTAELIAAGEVIERPASVIKELLENSVDAGAGHITVEIKRGGTTYMRISDDGCGISFDDVPLAFVRHATSKIIKPSDLESICTLGFRGEALASVSAVAKIEMRTKQREDEYGTFFSINGGISEEHEKQGCQDGTSIIVRDLFYNVPARQKFMKKDVSEGNAVSNVTSKIALSHPEISFRFIRDGKMEFTTSGDGEVYSAMYAIYGRTFAKDMIPVDYSDNGISIKGYIVKPLYARANRSFQNFFVNGRYIKSPVCSVSLEEGYKGVIMTGKFPSCVLMLDIPPSTIDVNAHPAKVEVKFSDEKRVFDSVFFAVKDALYKSGLIYEFQLDNNNNNTSSSENQQIPVGENIIKSDNQPLQNNQYINNSKPVAEFPAPFPLPKKETEPDALAERNRKISIGLENFAAAVTEKYGEIPSISPASIQKAEDEERKKEENQIPENTQLPINDDFRYIKQSSFEKKSSAPVCETENIYENFRHSRKEYLHVIGEAFENYIIAETDDKMIIFDKHAGHERIIYEQLKERNRIMESQLTMDISEILVPLEEFEAVKENTELLTKMGFEYDFSKPPYLKAKAVPVFLSSAFIDEATEEIAHNLYLNKVNPQTQIIDDLFHSLACKSAIKSHDKNNRAELQMLAEQIYFNDKIRHCPHGRPVMFVLTKREFEKQFKRIQ